MTSRSPPPTALARPDMGIELPAELADVAARTGVKWPVADEDKMREVAQAWRDTGQKITTLISEADTTARAALNTTEGASADSARRHWGTFVQPDTGHLTRIAKGCTANADKLDHAANQIGQAKLAIVRELTPLAKNINVAQHAAQAGDHTALLGLDTAIKGVAANIANVQSTLVTAVQPASGVVVDAVEPIVHTNPGGHGQNLLAPVTNLVDSAVHGGSHGPGLVPAVADAVPGVVNPVVDAVPGVGSSGGQHGPGVVPPVADVVPGVVNPVVDAVPGVGNSGGQHGPGVIPPVADVVPGVVNPIVDAVPGVGNPGHQPGVLPPSAVIPPGHSGDYGPGGSAGSAGSGAPGGPAHPAPPIQPPGGYGPDIRIPDPATGPIPMIGRDAPTPPAGIPARPDHGVHLAGASALLDAPAPQQAPAQGSPAIPAQPLANQPPAAPASPFAGGTAPPPPQAPPVAPVPPPQAGSGQPATQAPPQPQQQQAARGAVPFAVTAEPARHAPQHAVMAAPVPQGAQNEDQDQESVIALWLVRMFPIGHMPVATGRPARQLPPPPVEFDYAAGMRFEPDDHPQAELIDDAEALAWAVEGGDAVTSGPPAPADEITSGHDPLAGQNERDWARRFVVRAGHGRDTLDTEYAWPPSELFPEGATAPGEPEVLEPGTVIDRFGTPDGRVFAAADTSFAQRSLPPSHVYAEYRRYRVLKPLPVWRGISAAWFGQTGGGVRYRTTHPALDLIALGYLAEESALGDSQ
ncbi:TNT domain-containing protein [Kibdelosporangium aridum]|nr:TNT domain-containing protein [Kibdelosporangium aridum]